MHIVRKSNIYFASIMQFTNRTIVYDIHPQIFSYSKNETQHFDSCPVSIRARMFQKKSRFLPSPSSVSDSRWPVNYCWNRPFFAHMHCKCLSFVLCIYIVQVITQVVRIFVPKQLCPWFDIEKRLSLLNTRNIRIDHVSQIRTAWEMKTRSETLFPPTNKPVSHLHTTFCSCAFCEMSANRGRRHSINLPLC